MSGLLLVESVQSGEVPEARHLEAMVKAFFPPGTLAAQRAEAKLRDLLSRDATRDMARAALVAGSENDHPDIRGMSGLLLVESLESEEVPEARHLETMVNAFYRPDSAAAQRAEAKLRGLLSADETRQMARAALVAGSESEDRDIQSACRELLEEAGLLETARAAG
jgi:nucleoid-associated protein YgaU